MLYRNATLTDLPEIVRIYNSVIPGRMVTADTSPVTVADKLEWFNKHSANRPLWIAENDNQLIGWMSFSDFYGRPAYNGTAEISIYIDEQYRGCGYGKQILQHCIGKASDLDIHTLLGFIFSHNHPSLRLFEAHGFALWGELKEIAIMDDMKYSLTIVGLPIT